MRIVLRAGGCILLGCMAVSMAFGQTVGKQALHVPVTRKTIVRFFYLPPASYLHPALMFSVVGKGDLRLKTAPIAYPVERMSFITLLEMRSLIDALSHTGLSWQRPPTRETPTKVLNKDIPNQMEITVFSSGGTYRALIAPKRLCATLAPLNAVIKEPRAHWEMQLFRYSYKCKVPGFNRDAYFQP